jgi:hypothetical protein
MLPQAGARMVLGMLVISGASGGAAALFAQRERARAAKLAAGSTFAVLSAWELLWYIRRWRRRGQVYSEALETAHRLGRPLIVIGAPDGGVTSGYGCGDETIDIAPTSCPIWKPLDITKPLPYADNSVVVFCSCVLEYVSDPLAAIAEIKRISGGYAFFVGVEPWTLTATLYPGAKQTLPALYR